MKRKIQIVLVLLWGLIGSLYLCSNVDAEDTVTRIKDIARLQGVRSNQLTGMGLVIGLNGTGDTSKNNIQLVMNILTKYGYNSPNIDFRLKNAAAVMLTASLPPYIHQGDKIDVQVASYSDAKSLQGGVLLQSPLFGADGRVYAVAQGSVYIGSNPIVKNSIYSKNIVNSGMIPLGALVENEVPMQSTSNGKLRWALSNPDFTTAARLAKTINDNFARGAARAIDMGLVEVTIPQDKLADPISFIADIETLPITPDGSAKIVINEKTGSIVIGEQVKIAKVAVSHNNITVKINSDYTGSPYGSPYGGSGGFSYDGSNDPNESTGSGSLVELPEGTDIGTIVRALNSVGTTPQDIIAIIIAIKQAGAIYGILEFV